MPESLFKYIFILLIALSQLVWGQIPVKNIEVDIFPYLDILLSRAKKDISKEILNNRLNERVAIVRFESTGYDIDSKYRTLVIKNFEEMYEENKFFHLVGSIEALNQTIIVDSGLETYTTEQFTEMERYSVDLNADYYAIVTVSVVEKALALTLIIRHAQEHTIIWGKKWSTIFREGTTSFNIGFYQGITLPGVNITENMFPFSLYLGLDWKIFTFVDMGFFLDPGANILYLNDTDSNILGFSVHTGIRVAVDIINIFDVLYNNVELFLYIRTGLITTYYISHIYDTYVSLPVVAMSLRPGITTVINRNYAVFFEYSHFGVGSGEKAFFAGFYYRFEF